MYEYLVIDNSGNKYLNKVLFSCIFFVCLMLWTFPMYSLKVQWIFFYVCEKYTILSLVSFLLIYIITNIFLHDGRLLGLMTILNTLDCNTKLVPRQVISHFILSTQSANRTLRVSILCFICWILFWWIVYVFWHFIP